MRRKLISFDAFEDIEKGSLSHAANELVEAEEIIADVLGLDGVSLHCFDDTNVYYETDEGDYIHAGYSLDDDGYIRLENIEEVAIDTETLDNRRRDVVRQMVDAILADDKPRAKQHFKTYQEMAVPKMKFTKGRKDKTAMERRVANDKRHMVSEADDNGKSKKKKKKYKGGEVRVFGAIADPQRRLAAIEGHKGSPASYQKGQTKRRITMKSRKSKYKAAGRKRNLDIANRFEKTGRRTRLEPERKEKMTEWGQTANHILEYIDYITLAPSLAEVTVECDDVGNVVTANLPTKNLRAEGKLLALKWDTLKTDVKVHREKAQKLFLDESFQSLVSRIKRLNNLADDADLHEALTQLVTEHPTVLYLTQDELSQTVAEALEKAGATNFDDQICSFIAEGILRVAFESYPERVNRLASLANAKKAGEGEDPFAVFQSAVGGFFPEVDQQMQVEGQVFADLHTIFTEVRIAALEDGDDDLRQDAAKYLGQLESVLNGQVKPDLELAEDAAMYLTVLVETNLAMKPWNVVKTPYRTTVGEHPEMAKKAQHPYAPSRDFDGWPGKLPVSDGKNWKTGGKEEEMRNRAWGNVGGSGTYPSLQNPYVPKAGDWTLQYEPGVDKTSDSASGQWGSKDTWPVLQNPYVPQAVKKHVNSDNKVDDVESRVGLKQASDLDQKIS